jgi:ribose transport system substrate-binding protein
MKWMIPIGVLTVLMAVFIGILLATNGDLSSKDNIPQAVVLVGERGAPSDLVPTNSEISTARSRVGDDFVAIITCNRTSEYHASIVREMIDFLNEYDIPSRIYDSENDEGRQIAQIEQARSDGATGVIVCPLNINLLDDVLASIERAGLPLALYSPREDGYAYGGFAIVGNDYELGYKPGLFAGALIRDELDGEADVIILDFPDMPVIVERANGLEDGVLENAPDANIVGRFTGAIRDLGYESVRQLIADGVQFDVIVSINDAGSYGAIDALEEANIPPEDVMIVSVDAEALAREYIREGHYIRGSVAIDRTETAHALVDGIVKLLAGGTIPERISAQPGDIVTQETLASE